MTTLKVAINAQLSPGGSSGGVEQFLVSLINALGRLRDGSEEYIIIVRKENPDWLKPYLGDNQKTIFGPVREPHHRLLEQLKSLLGPLRGPAGKSWLKVSSFMCSRNTAYKFEVPKSNGFYENLGVELVHFPFQSFASCDLPTIFNPHDLQHLFYPQFFTPEQIAWRESIYPAGCRLSQAVAAESNSTKKDIVNYYSIDPNRVFVIPRGAPTELYEPVSESALHEVRQKFHVKERFAMYPAQTWPHKNHIRLLQALSLLRDRDGILVNLVCTGMKNDFWHVIKKQIHELRLDREGQVCFLGFVSTTELRALYRLAQFVIFPSLFEGGGFPLLEAFGEGTPVACSEVTSLPEYGGDAALYFDPLSVESIARALQRMSTDANLRARLRQRGAKRISLFTWQRTARTYRALYRKLAGQPLSEEENALLANPQELQKGPTPTEKA